MNSHHSPPLARAGTIWPFAIAITIACAFSILPPTATAQWFNGHRANAVLGQADFTSNGFATSASRMDFAAGVAIDPASGKVFVCDVTQNRILRFSSTAAMSQGASAEAVFGQPDFTTGTLSNPPTQSSFRTPEGIFVDSQGRLWVADTGNNRVLRFDNASALGNQPNADGVLGQPDFVSDTLGITASGMRLPVDLSVGWLGALWVADPLNNRVLRFDNASNKGNGAPADGVLGQPGFATVNSGIAQNAMNSPKGIALRTVSVGFFQFHTELWVSDTSNNRVLRFDNAAGKSDGANADGVLGQEFFTSAGPGFGPNRLHGPEGLAIGPGGHLWVADRWNHRVLRFANAESKANGATANHVIGQTSLTSVSVPTTSQTRLNQPVRVALDDAENLFVADRLNRRVLRFSPGTPRPDNLVGKSASLASQRGDGIYNTSAAGQKINVRKKRPKAKVHFTVQNEGPFDDRFRLKATRRNRKLKVKYFDLSHGRANVTAQITQGNYVTDIAYRSSIRFFAKARMTKRAGNRAKRPFFLQASSLSNGAADKVLAKVVLKPKR